MVKLFSTTKLVWRWRYNLDKEKVKNWTDKQWFDYLKKEGEIYEDKNLDG